MNDTIDDILRIQDTICAGVVLYNPQDLDRVTECLSNLTRQVKYVYVFDNCTTEHNLNLSSNGIRYLKKDGNMGLAYALNCIMESAEKDGFEWVVTMDQDSIIPDNLVKGYCKCIMRINGMGICCPQVIDRRRPYLKPIDSEEYEFIERCITSASCTSVKAWRNIGKFDEWLFIDLIDEEFCKRMRLNNYEIVRLNKYVLDQQFGNVIPKSKRKQKFWLKLSEITHVTRFQHLTYYNVVSPLRVYYTNRNIIYVNKKYKNYKFNFYYVYGCKNRLEFLIWYCFTRLLLSKKKLEVANAIFRGIRDGKRKSVLPYCVESVTRAERERNER